MLKLYDPLEDNLTLFRRNKKVVELIHYASEVMESLGFSEKDELRTAINRTFEICLALHISIDENFRTIYRFNGNDLIPDWKLSALACYLITINANPANPNVAKSQLFFIIQKSKDVEI